VGQRIALFDDASQQDTHVWVEAAENEQYSPTHPTMPDLPAPNIAPYNILARQLSLSDLTPFARRSYPAYLLADEQSWLAIERGKESNLALSAEEEQILKSVSTTVPGNGSLPLFINGRAGSGKSTMLLYLFADYCYRKYHDKQGRRRSEPLPGEPLFLTYNERLLEVAKEGVTTLLSSHHRFVAERTQKEEIERVDHFFQPFQKFLFDLLPQSERVHFNQEKYISFHRFKQLYQGINPVESKAIPSLQLPQAKRYSPETCWHVIRSFIKGYGLEENMTPEDYQEEVPRKEHTISLEKFQGIYDTIWERWYKRITKEQGYWDDQDLIAKVLELKCYRPNYTAIFCDEAQDFTRLELQVIMRLSIFSQYNLGYQPIHSLPFAFAGDPFQTLNPTGFHWSSVQSVFDAEVITALDPADQLKLAINFQALTFNYRSTPPIVQVTNLIQLWRHVLFDIYELQPQTAWHPGNFPQPQKFILEQNINKETLADYIKDTIIIVPCEEGEEVDYAKADEVLSELFYKPASAENLKNVLSAISAKGLEFKKVILYKFGEECNQSVWNLKGKSTDQRVKIEYFFNKLYVAASRATEHLFVVDSEKGDRQLWQYASDEALLQVMLRFAKNRERWENSVQTISTGTPKTVQQLREDNPKAIAQEFETQGLNSQNPDFLRRAKQFYQDLGELNKAIFCEACALKFEQQFLSAGIYFLQLDNAEEAWQCFWQGMYWAELVNLYNQHPENHLTEHNIATFMVAETQDLEAVNNFTTFVKSQVLDDSLAAKLSLNSKQWKKAIEEYVNRLKALLNTPIDSETWQQFGEVIEALEIPENNELKQLAADCFYRSENYEQALRYWEAENATQKPEYNRAKAKLLPIPDSLQYLSQAGDYDSIITQWEQAGKPRERRWIEYVAPALEAKQQYQQAFVVYIWLDELVKVKQCFEIASQGTPPIKLIAVLLQYFYRHHYWIDAIEVLEKYLPFIVGSERQKASLKFDAVYEIACSEFKQDDLTKQARQQYEQFIKEQILSTNEWNKYLLMQQVGIALEKIGLLVETLEFYEQFFSDSDQVISKFARERWIATKKKQEDYHRSLGQYERASKSHSEMLKKARNWSIQQHSIAIETPTASKERPNIERLDPRATLTDFSRPPISTKFAIKGLPNTIKIEQLEAGVVRFSVRHLVVKVMKQSKQILITDALNNREVRVDGVQGKINIGEATVEAAGSNRLSFALSTSGYKGILFIDAHKTKLELDVQGLVEQISIEL
jgi:tetratricopeptide (TPR) repeat protein